MLKAIFYFFRQRRAATAIEFSLVFIPFISSVLFIAEMCRVVYISSAIDLILAESAQIASLTTTPENYEKYFKAEINKRMSRWPLLSSNLNAVLKINYCSSITQVIDGQCASTVGVGMPLALYHVETDYQPLFFIFPASIMNGELSRTVLLVQEFQDAD